MRYLLMIHGNQEVWEGDGLPTWSRDDVKTMIDFMRDLDRELTDSGELVRAEGLSGPADARTVYARPGEEPLVTDGPYAEVKEFLAGFWLVEVPTEQRAFEIAARISATPGPGGAPVNQPVVVRPIGEPPKV
ncbi:YciI family protein [Solihabitans fulvus]|uniref:YciI family protein n=1 Tax=Solihabitans fulvus TaxID=1892852 RepID=UPI001661CE66|nr:YciI family protein [Solihabitans fulvus]